MSERMTPERERDIREQVDPNPMVADLLTELDAVRADLAIHLRSSNEAGAALVQAWRERDEARAELKQQQNEAGAVRRHYLHEKDRAEQERSRREAAEKGRETAVETANRTYINYKSAHARIDALEAALREAKRTSYLQGHLDGYEHAAAGYSYAKSEEMAEALLSPGEKPPTPEPTSVVDLEKWRKLAFSLCDSRHWSRTPLNRLGVHVEEAVELSTAVRGKGGDVEEEAGDALFTLLAMIPPEFSLAGVFARNVRKVEALFSAPVGQNHEEVEPPTPEPGE